MAETIKYVKYKTKRGFVRRGGPHFARPLNDALTMQVAAWVAAQMEAANFGTVQSYDGAGMSAGPPHFIAYQPASGSQGALFGMVARIFAAAPAASAGLMARFAAKGWRLAEDGLVRFAATGAVVPGKQIREEFTGPLGVTPSSGPQHQNAREWIRIFGNLFSVPATFQPQVDYTVKYLCAGHVAEELAVYRRYARLNGQPMTIDSAVSLPRARLPAEIDFCMSAYHSHSVNGPSVAFKILKRVSLTLSPMQFAKTLIRGLGLSNYGRWHDDPDDKVSRYDSTRRVMTNSGLWDVAMCKAIMPRNL